jgi:hypothetical protein
MRVLLVGDLHANTPWLEHVVYPAAERLEVGAICQLGDFGYWPGSREGFLEAAELAPVPLYFLDGNHEHHDALAAHVAHARERECLGSFEPVPFGGQLHYLPRGARLEWGGVVVGVLGGAHSIDRAYRTMGRDWFSDEDISDADVERLAEGGSCQVLLTHDAPSAAALPLMLPRDEAWLRELGACELGREKLNDAVDRTRPELVVHGHYHKRWSLRVKREWGSYRLVGLSEDGSDIAGNLALLECGNGTTELYDLYEIDGVDPTGVR